MPLAMRQLDRMEQEHDQQGSGLLWNLYVPLCTISRSLTDHHNTATHIQIALNAAIPASSLCINRQLYKVSRMKTAGMTDVEKRRNLIYDLLIGIGIPILQMIASEWAQPFVANRLYTRTQSRVRCFRISLRHFWGCRPSPFFLAHATDLCPLSCVARGDWHRISLLLWWVFLALLRPLVPLLINISERHLRVLQAQTKPYAVNFQCQSWPVPPFDGYLLHRDTRDHSVGDVLHRDQCEGGCRTLEGLGSHA